MSPIKPATEALQPKEIPSGGLSWYFGFFFVSGFCSLMYELVWLRLAMAQFGVTTALVSIVLSTFMAGLGIGSWAAGHIVRKYANKLTAPPLHLYGVAEILIGCSAVVVPLELVAGRWVLEHVGNSLSLSSGGYYVAAGIWLALTMIPWCSCMGATIPLAMYAIRRDKNLESKRSFSFLYLANVLGAVAGALVPLGLIEFWGFSGTLEFGTVLNIAICAGALWLASQQAQQSAASNADNFATTDSQPADSQEVRSEPAASSSVTVREMLGNGTLWLLFATGLTSMGMEVVWSRQFTLYVGTLVYSFAAILAVYLAATFLGSTLYRLWSKKHHNESPLVWMAVWIAALLPLVAADKRVDLLTFARVPLGIGLFSGLLGFLTPRLVDRFSEGDPNRAGVGYAVNVAGCILGPLVAGFLLLPNIDERYSLVVLALPWLIVGVGFALFGQSGKTDLNQRRLGKAGIAVATGAMAVASFFMISATKNYTQLFPGAVVRRDSTATVMATGEGMQKLLYVNGVNMTVLTPITKLMAALPLTHLSRPPQNALVICFGMGTTHRSMISWGIDSTVVDLVPSVPKLFPYFHSDAQKVLSSPHSHVVADDGRRFLERTTQQFDVIIIDPPPPIGAAGSSLLYSKEFYTVAKKHLRPDGILQQWFPGGDRATTASVARALKESFPYVRVFGSLEGWGLHYLASRQPIPERSAHDLASRMPDNAVRDLVEWGPYRSAEDQLAATLKREYDLDSVIAVSPNSPAMVDDRPVNEYSFLRSVNGAMGGAQP
jgi:spermidine synthase